MLLPLFIYIYLARIVTQERERDNIRHHAVLGKKLSTSVLKLPSVNLLYMHVDDTKITRETIQCL